MSLQGTILGGSIFTNINLYTQKFSSCSAFYTNPTTKPHAIPIAYNSNRIHRFSFIFLFLLKSKSIPTPAPETSPATPDQRADTFYRDDTCCTGNAGPACAPCTERGCHERSHRICGIYDLNDPALRSQQRLSYI